MHILITGGAGFIGSTVVKYILQHTDHHVVNLDKLTYAADLSTLSDIEENPRYHFEQVDICDRTELDRVFAHYPIEAVMNLAAETHVDRSIDGPAVFVETNVVGTCTLLQAARRHWQSLPEGNNFRFHHISTDEVYGDLETPETPPFSETTPYAPNSPYSASKASSDHMVRAWHRTYGLPVIITNCSNNYGPYQFPEKLIPHMILNALGGKPLPVYGDGQQIRDWLYVEDHAQALYEVLIKGKIGDTYNIGGNSEKKNIEVVEALCAILDELVPADTPYSDLITYVTDRPGHDRRYAIDAQKIKNELGWEPAHNFEDGLRETVQWYLDYKDWWQNILEGKNLERIGTAS